MKIPKLAVVTALVTLFAAAAGTLIAAGTTGSTVTVHRHRGEGAFLGRMLHDPNLQEELALTEDQIARLRTLRDESRATIRDLRAASIRARADLRSTLLDTNASREELEKKAAAVRDSVSAVSKEATRRLLDARDVLTVDQRDKLLSMVGPRSGAGRGFRARRLHRRGWSVDTETNIH